MTYHKMTNLSDVQIAAYCSKLNLTRARFLAEKGNLEKKKDSQGNSAYSEEQINRLIFRKSSKKTIQTLLNCHDDLIKSGLTPQQIYQLAAHNGGSNNLKAYIEQTQALQAQNLSWSSLSLKVNDVLCLLAHNGGSRNLKAYIKQTQALKAHNLSGTVFGLNVKEVLHILAKDGGSQALDTLLDSFNQLRHLGFTTRQLITIAKKKGGAKALAAVLKHTPQLLTQAYSLDFICTLAARIGGAKKIQQSKHNESLTCRHDEVTTGRSQELTLNARSTKELDAYLCDIDEDELSEYLHSFATSENNEEEYARLFGDITAEEHEPFSAIKNHTITQIPYDTDEQHKALLFGNNRETFFSEMELEAAASASTHSASPLFFSHKRKLSPRESNTKEDESKKTKEDELFKPASYML
ncbi:hypothetical protein [Legionella sp. km772]|uniref:hypothetical protein n=1 Tax=Legionella sp. km772 TaxID=2498111 RepID=UPI000F8EBBFE|nr:hypothetical protein [Legionella sp. km772]RUR13352.1 hypothetical protein ELY15_02585 [Legionella sp. km772]